MNTTLSADGKVQIPLELWEGAKLKAGDTMDIHLYQGSLVLRKHEALSPDQVAALLDRSRALPKPTPDDDAAIEQAIREARSQRR